MSFGSTQEYNTIHKWMARNFGKADRCDFNNLHQSMRFHWANISGVYKRDRVDWLRLCPPCHRLFDLGDVHEGHVYGEDMYKAPSGKKECNICRKARHKVYNREYNQSKKRKLWTQVKFQN